MRNMTLGKTWPSTHRIRSAQQYKKTDKVPPHKSIPRGNKTSPQTIQVKGKQLPQKPQVQSKPADLKARKPAVAVQRKVGNPIPHAPPSKALSFKMPKGIAKDSSQLIQKRLQKQSPWYQSIVDPMHGADAKIPDETGVDTGVVQIVHRQTFETRSNGTGGLKLLTPYINQAGEPNYSTLYSRNIQYFNPAVLDDSFTWGAHKQADETWQAGLARPLEGSQDLLAITDQHRIVSCAIYVQPECSLANNQGELCLFMDPWSQTTSPNYSDYVNSYKSVVIPLNSNKPSLVRWWPEDRSFLGFKGFYSTDGRTPLDGTAEIDGYPLWGLGIIAFGCDTEKPVTIRCTIVVNYEFIPKYNTLNVLAASPSPQDMTEVELVGNWTQDLPSGTIVSQKVASSSPSVVEPVHGENDSGTGFGMFFNVVKELAPLALALL